MFLTDDPTAVSTLPTPGTPGTPGYFTDGNPGSGVPATILQADFMNMIMMELQNIILAASLTPSKTTFNQVLQALPAALASRPEMAKSLATNGYQKLPGGLIIQWGTGTASTSDFANTLPIAFPTAKLSLALADIDLNPLTTFVSVSAFTTTGFNLTVNTGANRNVFWIALGY